MNLFPITWEIRSLVSLWTYWCISHLVLDEPWNVCFRRLPLGTRDQKKMLKAKATNANNRQQQKTSITGKWTQQLIHKLLQPGLEKEPEEIYNGKTHRSSARKQVEHSIGASKRVHQCTNQHGCPKSNKRPAKILGLIIIATEDLQTKDSKPKEHQADQLIYKRQSI